MTAPALSVPILTAATLIAAAAATSTYAALSAQSQLFGPILIAGHDPNELALTFDDGPNPAATPQLLDLLAAAGARATFFLVGRHVRTEPALTRRIAAAGHLVGNHTLTHPWLAWQPPARIHAEIAGCNAALEDTLGAPARLFRPPHGARRPAVLRIARELGLTPVNWNILIHDWKPTAPATLLTRIDRGIARNRRAGRASNLVLHDGDGLTQNANRLPTLEATRQLLASSPHRFVTPDTWL